MVEGIRCIQSKVDFSLSITVTCEHTTTAGKQVLTNKANKNANSQCLCDKLSCDHARSEQLRKVVEGIKCIQPKFDSQITMTVASKHISVAGQQVV